MCSLARLHLCDGAAIYSSLHQLSLIQRFAPLQAAHTAREAPQNKKKILHLQLWPFRRVIKWGHGERTCSKASQGNLQASLHTFKHHVASNERERKKEKCFHTKLKSIRRVSAFRGIITRKYNCKYLKKSEKKSWKGQCAPLPRPTWAQSFSNHSSGFRPRT